MGWSIHLEFDQLLSKQTSQSGIFYLIDYARISPHPDPHPSRVNVNPDCFFIQSSAPSFQDLLLGSRKIVEWNARIEEHSSAVSRNFLWSESTRLLAMQRTTQSNARSKWEQLVMKSFRFRFRSNQMRSIDFELKTKEQSPLDEPSNSMSSPDSIPFPLQTWTKVEKCPPSPWKLRDFHRPCQTWASDWWRRPLSSSFIRRISSRTNSSRSSKGVAQRDTQTKEIFLFPSRHDQCPKQRDILHLQSVFIKPQYVDFHILISEFQLRSRADR